MVRNIQIEAVEYVCDKCGSRRLSTDRSAPLPERCLNQSCRSRSWNGQKQASHTQELKLPAPRPRGRPRSSVADDYDEQ